MDYQQTIEYLYSQLPVFQRIGAAAYKADLNNTIELCNLLDNPQKDFKSVHIAGTNGKGSVSHFIASVLQSKGLRVGLYTSPHLKDFRERIRINGKFISKSYVTDFVKKYKQSFDEIGLSFFEMTVGLAFKYFSDEKVDIAIIEAGLGGRLDSTNIINPELSIITNISFDHTALLGNTLRLIAGEKAGIIKPNTAVVVGETQEEIKDVFTNRANELNADIYFADSEFQVLSSKTHASKSQMILDVYKNGKLYIEGLSSPLRGNYQKKNIITVIQALEILSKAGYDIRENEIKNGIEGVIKNTGLMGRWQTLSKSPLTICDVGHNEAGIKEIINQINNTAHNKLHFVFGMVNDKESDSILKLMPKDAEYYFCKADIPRGLDTNILFEKATNYGLKGKTYSSVKEALEKAKECAEKDDLIFIGGSTFIVAEII